MSELVISKKSWHYRLYNKSRDLVDSDYHRWSADASDPKTLCGYFWSWIFNVGFAGIVVTCLILLAALLVLHLPVLLWSWLVNHNQSAERCFITMMAVWSALTLFVVINLIWAAIENRAIRLRAAGKKENAPLSGAGVVFQYFSAAKRKVCPFIKYQ